MKQDVEGSARNRPGTGSREPSVGSSAGAVLAALGVGLCPACFGFTMGFTGTALDALTKPPSEGGALTASEAASFTAAATLSAAVGSLLGGPMADRWGRKRGLVVAMAVCGVGFVLIALGREYHALLAGRLLGGLAIGAVSVATPLYLAEISPPRLRGALGSTMQLAIVSGLLLVYVVGYEVVPTRGWRCLAAIGALIPTVRLTALSPLPLISSYKPESPCADRARWRLVARTSQHAAGEAVGLPLSTGRLLRGKPATSHTASGRTCCSAALPRVRLHAVLPRPLCKLVGGKGLACSRTWKTRGSTSTRLPVAFALSLLTVGVTEFLSLERRTPAIRSFGCLCTVLTASCVHLCLGAPL